MKKCKKITALFLAAVTSLLVASCGASGGKDVTVDIEALADELKSGITYQDTLEHIDAEMVGMVYEVMDSVEKSVVYMGSGATAEEIAVFECKDADTAQNKVEPVALQHIQDQIASFESYVPGEVTKLKDAVVKRSGKYVAVSVSDDAAGAKKILDRYFK